MCAAEGVPLEIAERVRRSARAQIARQEHNLATLTTVEDSDPDQMAAEIARLRRIYIDAQRDELHAVARRRSAVGPRAA